MRLAPALLLLCLGATPVLAEKSDAGRPGENARFSMTPTKDGFLRLDTRTGAVSLCTVTGTSAQCRAAADDREALTEEIERLAKRNAQLAGTAGVRALPPQEDMNRAMDLAEQFMRRMLRIMRDDSKDPT